VISVVELGSDMKLPCKEDEEIRGAGGRSRDIYIKRHSALSDGEGTKAERKAL